MRRIPVTDFRVWLGTPRIFTLTLALALLAAPLPVEAQQAAKIPRVGFLGATSGSDPRVEAFRQGLRDLGYVEGKNLIIEYRWAEGRYDRLPALAAELVGLPVDLLVCHGTPGTWAAKRATATTPIVMATSGDAVANGLIASLARPGGNITGTTFFSPEVTAKRLELLQEVVPLLRRVGVLVNPSDPGTTAILRAMVLTGTSLNVALDQFEVRGPSEFEGAFTAMAQRRIDALVTTNDGTFVANRRRLADFAAQRRLPSAGFKEFAQAGGLMAYGVDFAELYRRAAVFVDKILRGAKPPDLPVEQPTRFDLVINLKTAKTLGLTIPQSLLMRADEVIQ